MASPANKAGRTISSNGRNQNTITQPGLGGAMDGTMTESSATKATLAPKKRRTNIVAG